MLICTYLIRVDIDITVKPDDAAEIFNQVEETTSNLDNENHEFGFEVASKEEIQEIAAEFVMYELQGESNVLQRVRGYVLIPYEFEGNEDTLEYDPSSIFVRSSLIKSSLSIKRV